MKKIFVALFAMLIAFACSHQKKATSYSIASASQGMVKSSFLHFPVYLTNTFENPALPSDALLVHTGHFLSPQKSKEENEGILKLLEEKNFHLVNLTITDVMVADSLGINFENYPKLIFLNSAIYDLKNDKIFLGQNIKDNYVLNGISFIGLTDREIPTQLKNSRFIIADYVSSILKIKKNTQVEKINSYVLIHQLGGDINPIMERLPPSFVNSAAD